MKSAVLFLLLVFSFTLACADATPKLNSRPELEFYKDGSIIKDFDSLLIKAQLRDLDSVQLLYPSLERRDFTQNVLYYNGTNYFIDARTPIQSFKIFIVFEGEKYSSGLINLMGDKSFFKFKLINDGKIESNHNLLYSRWIVYFKSLIITLLLEFCVVFLILRKYNEIRVKLFFVIFLINLLSHFTLWFVDSRIEISLIILELIVILVESIVCLPLFKGQIPFKKMLLSIILANITSWWLGSIIHWIIK